MKKLALLIAALFCASAFADDLPRIAVYVTGDVPDNEKKALGTRMLASLINSGRYKGIERSNSFLAEIEKEQEKQRSGSIDDGQISELGRQFGVKFVCIADITPAFGDFQVSARIINVETAEVEFIGESASPLKSMADLARVSDQVVKNMFSEEAKQKAKTALPKSEPPAREPSPAAVSRTKTGLSKPEPAAPKRNGGIRMSAGGGGFFANDFGGGVQFNFMAAGYMPAEITAKTPYTGGGAYVFFDAVYAEISVGYFEGGGKWVMDATVPIDIGDNNDASFSALSIGLLGKYPIALSDNITLFPAAGIDYQPVLSGKDKYASDGETYEEVWEEDAGDYSALFFRFGAGIDFAIAGKVYLRPEFLYGFRLANKGENGVIDMLKEEYGALGGHAKTRLGHGLTIRVGAGYKF